MTKPENANPGDYISIGEFARRIGFSPETIRRRLVKGDFAGIECVDFLGNNRLRFRTSHVEQFIRDRRHEAKVG